MWRNILLFASTISLIQGSSVQVDDHKYLDKPPKDIWEINFEQYIKFNRLRDCKEFDTTKCTGCPQLLQSYLVDNDGCVFSCSCKDDPDKLIGGDMKIGENNIEYVSKYLGKELPQPQARAMTSKDSILWPGSSDGKVYVPYRDNEIGYNQKNALDRAIQEYKDNTCIRFIRRTNEQNYINFINDRGGCWSYVGMSGGPQALSLTDGCQYTGIVIHEVMHALGFFHEQSRPDRDRYITIHKQNIISGLEDNFEPAVASSINSRGSPYDYASVMHYGKNAFSSNGKPTITVNSGNVEIGQRKGFSKQDLYQINAAYCGGSNSGDNNNQGGGWGGGGGDGGAGGGGYVRPVTKPTQRPVVRPSNGCKNKFSDRSCDYWQKRGYCNKAYVAFMAKHCTASCGYCDEHGSRLILEADWDIGDSPPARGEQRSAESCKNKQEDYLCEKFKGFCVGDYGDIMTMNCALTCNKCGYVNPTRITPKITTTPRKAAVTITSDECGQPYIMDRTYARIVGGDEAARGSIPWQVSIRIGHGSSSSHSCGATLISHQWIVTAAHCIKKKYLSEYSAILGLHEKNPSEDGSSQYVEVEFSEVHIHPDYSKKNMDSDIALIKMKERVEYTSYILPICLAREDPPPLSYVTSSGWGDTMSTKHSNEILRKVSLPVQYNWVCNKWMNEASKSKGYEAHLTTNMLCAGVKNGGKDSCQGDSGGPLIYKGNGYNGKHYLVGIVSWGYGCADPLNPGIYTRVSRYVNWINKITEVSLHSLV